MIDTLPNGESVPEGLEFLNLIWRHEDLCEQNTDEQLPKLGVKAPETIKNLGTVLSLLDRLSGCFWGCRKGDHVIEYIAGRTCSTARASLRLMRFGFYDEALSLVRSIGEVSNLLFLFVKDNSALKDWKSFDDQSRQKFFSPVQVRLRLQNLGFPLPINQKQYRQLSERAAHVTPKTMPQKYNILDTPLIGAIFQEAGALVVLNELSVTMAVSLLCATKLINPDEDNRKYVKAAVMKLVHSLGGVSITNISEMFDTLRRNLEKA